MKQQPNKLTTGHHNVFCLFSNAGTSLSIFVERDGEVIQQSLSATAMTALTANLAALTTASGQSVGLVIPAPGVVMMSSSSTFGFFMSIKLQSSEFAIIQQALAAEWNVQYEGLLTDASQ